MAIKISMNDEARNELLAEARAEAEKQRKLDAAKELLQHETMIYQLVQKLLKNRRTYNKAAKEISNQIDALKTFMDEAGENIVDYRGYYNKWKELRLDRSVGALPDPSVFED